MSRLLAVGFLRLAVFCLLGLLTCSCNQQPLPVPEHQADSAARVIRIGLLPELDLFTQKKCYEPLLAQLGKQIGVSFQIKVLPRYGALVDNFSDLNLDGAFFGSFTGALAIKNLGIEPLAKPQYADGVSSAFGMILVKKGSGIKTAQDMRDKRMVFVDPATSTGFLVPLAFFKSLGIADYKGWFKEYYFSGTQEDAIRDVLNGYADIGAAKSTIYDLLAESEPRILSDLEILATSPPLPANTFAVRPDLDKDLKKALKEGLLTLHQSQAGRAALKNLKAEKFTEASAQDSQAVYDYAASAGLDLRSIHYSAN